MIKIAFVTNYITNNGPSNVILDIIRNLDKEQYSVSLITLFKGNDERIVADLRNNGVQIFTCKTLSRAKCLLGQDREFQELVKREGFDIIHSHGIIPDILSSRVKTSVRKVTTLHNNMFEDYVQTYGKVKAKIFIKMHIDALKKMDCRVGCSKSVYQVMREYLKNVIFIRNGIKPKIAKHTVTRKELDIPEDAVVFVFSGGLSFRKNVQFLTQNFVQYHNKDEYLLLLGDGPEREACEQMVDDHVKLLGFQDDPAAYYNISNIYASASRSEGFSISVLEALSCGLGLFLSDIPSHREVVGMGEDLYLGENFSIQNDGRSFNTAMGELRKNFNRVDKEAIKDFQLKKLSDKAMTVKYDKEYNKFLKAGD
ncbi:glycosyl transferase [Latilactobacillus sakei]|uniref:glycosyltransferase n=1 Tax=Latilactobacillus sakei TaxID=1599 RepID=UPI001143E9AD|nr:glycosyltransferase [Latilactobacillus sakei]GEA77159.1 glycosyl transferase [Latilactobacillus sakei]